MSYTVTRTNLISTFIAAWTDTPVATDNVKYKPTGAAYVLAQIASTISEQPCLGRKTGETWERDLGDLVLSVFVPVNGAIDGAGLAEKAKNIMSQKRFSETITDAGFVQSAGVQEDARYYRFNVIVPFRTDNIKQEV
jgi:hypothetical protein